VIVDNTVKSTVICTSSSIVSFALPTRMCDSQNWTDVGGSAELRVGITRCHTLLRVDTLYRVRYDLSDISAIA
jgi:hypothetical protein